MLNSMLVEEMVGVGGGTGRGVGLLLGRGLLVMVDGVHISKDDDQVAGIHNSVAGLMFAPLGGQHLSKCMLFWLATKGPFSIGSRA